MGEFNKRPGKTVTGLVWHDTAKDTANSRNVLLYDFDIDGWDLKPRHEIWILEAVTFMADDIAARRKGVLPKWATTGPQWKVWMNGWASKTGEFAHNVQLSANREQAVEKKFKAEMAKKGLTEDDVAYASVFHGSKGVTVTGEHEEGRSVSIIIQRPEKAPPVFDLPKPPSTDVYTNSFKIRLVKQAGAGVPLPRPFDKGPTISVVSALFEIQDESSKSAFFLLVGSGFKIPFPFKVPWIPGGPSTNLFRPFTAETITQGAPRRKIKFSDFEGDADLVKGLPGAKPTLKLNGEPKKFFLHTFPQPIPLYTSLEAQVFEGLSGPFTLFSI